MKIGYISQWYEPEPGAAAHPTTIARAMVERGHQVRTLTSYPSYPLGKVYDGYRLGVRSHEIRDGVELLRVPDVPSHDDNAIRRALSLTSFAASATAQVGWLRGADACLVYLTPATVGVAAMALKALAGVPYVLYVQDLWPETITASGFISDTGTNRRVEKILSTYLRRLYRGAEGVAAISPTMARTLSTRGPRTEPVSVPNWVDESIFKPARPAIAEHRGLPSSRTWIMYAGGIGEVQALHHAVRAIGLLGDRPDIGLALVGDGTALRGLEALAHDLGIADRVRILGSRPMQEMPALMAQADAQLISLRDLPLFAGTIPSKLQASMACAAPVICAVAGDAAELVGRVGAGLAVAPENAVALAGAFRAIADMAPAERTEMGARGRAAYLNELSASAGGARLEAMLTRAAESRRR